VSTLSEKAPQDVDTAGPVSVKRTDAGHALKLTAHTTGTPIAADDLPHIFDRFYRSDKARTSGTGGFGLGLAIARETARAHEGDITCTSTEADGTTFLVTLPIA
ncbi:MAG: sensor histidine kinase, partial [Eggerthellaceae bacterium]|nr:sensor histidine kinase [Eggerthellaceae bacterium]